MGKEGKEVYQSAAIHWHREKITLNNPGQVLYTHQTSVSPQEASPRLGREKDRENQIVWEEGAVLLPSPGGNSMWNPLISTDFPAVPQTENAGFSPGFQGKQPWFIPLH